MSAWLRSLASEATPGPWEQHMAGVYRDGRAVAWAAGEQVRRTYEVVTANARLIALAPSLALLCAELGEALEKIAKRDSRTRPPDGTREPITADADMRTIARAALAKLEELEATHVT